MDGNEKRHIGIKPGREGDDGTEGQRDYVTKGRLKWNISHLLSPYCQLQAAKCQLDAQR